MDAPSASLPFWLPSATRYGHSVDILFAGLLTVSLLVCVLLLVLLLRFIVRYREGADADRDHRIKKSWHWEVSWTVATLVGFLALFVWGTKLFSRSVRSPCRRVCRSTSSPSNGCGKCNTSGTARDQRTACPRGQALG